MNQFYYKLFDVGIRKTIQREHADIDTGSEKKKMNEKGSMSRALRRLQNE